MVSTSRTTGKNSPQNPLACEQDESQDDLIIVEPSKFTVWAGQSQEAWDLLDGLKIHHNEFGEGRIIHAEVTPTHHVTIQIEFRTTGRPVVKKYDPMVLFEVDTLEFPPEICERIPKPRVQGGPAPVAFPGKRVKNKNAAAAAVETPVRHETEALFAVDDDVFVANNPGRRGRVSRVIPVRGAETNYEVYFSADDQTILKESDLKPYVQNFNWGQLDELLRDLTMAKMKTPMSDALYALYASRTKFEVYQFKPVLKFLSNPDQRLLIADEVGLGKTIEAGIIYLELQARIGLDRVLLVCPSSLKEKWKSEMKSRFDEDFEILDTAGMRDLLGALKRPGSHPPIRAIISLEAIRRRELAVQFENVKFDLVIIDEAHHCRNTGTLANSIASLLMDNSDAALMLTATPLQMGQADLFNLLRILSPGEFDNFDAFATRLEPNEYINRAAEYLGRGKLVEARKTLELVEQTAERKRFLGNPYYHTIIQTLQSPHPSRAELVATQRRLLELNTLASIFTRTRKRDVQEKAPIRTAFTLTVKFTPEETQFYNSVVEEVRYNYQMSHYNGQGSGWITIMKERQAASCISALIKKEAAARLESNPEEDVFENEFIPMDEGELEAQQSRPRRILSLFPPDKPARPRPLPRNIKDSKFEVFWGALKKVLDEDPRSKILVFSFFVGTIDYLGQELKKLRVNVRTIHGGYAVSDRQRIIEEFRDSPEVRVLVSSDVGSEGLDFQFCNTLFNYDLPWNPMKVEQRIGRIDRFGQESDRVRIYNLVIENSIESRILMRLYDRIEIFRHAIGDIEVILGDQIRGLTEAVFSKNLSADEEIKQAEDAVNIVLRKKLEMEEFEEKRMQFLGQEAILSTAVNNTIDSGRYISDVEVHALVSWYIREKFKHSRLERNTEDEATYTLHVNDDLAQEIKTYIYGIKKSDRTAQQFIPKLTPGTEIPLTFEHELAYKRKLLEFVTPRHPLAQAAMDHWREMNQEHSLVYKVSFKTDIAPSGKYYFFIYSMRTEGVEKDYRIIPVVLSADSGDLHNRLSDQFLKLAQTSGYKTNLVFEERDLDAAKHEAESHMMVIRDRLRQEAMASNEALVNARLAAVDQSFNAKKRHISEIQGKVNHPGIIKMHEGQIRNLAAKKVAKEKEIERGRSLQVGFSLQLRGFLDVVSEPV